MERTEYRDKAVKDQEAVQCRTGFWARQGDTLKLAVLAHAIAAVGDALYRLASWLWQHVQIAVSVVWRP